MTTAFEGIKWGLEEAIKFARGEDTGAIVHFKEIEKSADDKIHSDGG